MITIDAMGRSCPEPVIMLRNALKARPEACAITVDNVAARENCARFASHAGYQVTVTGVGGVYTLEMKK